MRLTGGPLSDHSIVALVNTTLTVVQFPCKPFVTSVNYVVWKSITRFSMKVQLVRLIPLKNFAHPLIFTLGVSEG